MNTVNYRFSPGDKVFGVNFYPIGARIFESTVSKVYITIRPYNDRLRSITQFHVIVYELENVNFRNFKEEDVFATIEEAKQAKENWLKQIKDKQHEKDLNAPSILPYNDDRASTTTTQRISAFRRRNS